MQETNPNYRKGKHTLIPTDHFAHHTTAEFDNDFSYTSFAVLADDEPENYCEALASPDRDKWIDAMQKEIHLLREAGTGN